MLYCGIYFFITKLRCEIAAKLTQDWRLFLSLQQLKMSEHSSSTLRADDLLRARMVSKSSNMQRPAHPPFPPAAARTPDRDGLALKIIPPTFSPMVSKEHLRPFEHSGDPKFRVRRLSAPPSQRRSQMHATPSPSPPFQPPQQPPLPYPQRRSSPTDLLHSDYSWDGWEQPSFLAAPRRAPIQRPQSLCRPGAACPVQPDGVLTGQYHTYQRGMAYTPDYAPPRMNYANSPANGMYPTLPYPTGTNSLNRKPRKHRHHRRQNNCREMPQPSHNPLHNYATNPPPEPYYPSQPWHGSPIQPYPMYPPIGVPVYGDVQLDSFAPQQQLVIPQWYPVQQQQCQKSLVSSGTLEKKRDVLISRITTSEEPNVVSRPQYAPQRGIDSPGIGFEPLLRSSALQNIDHPAWKHAVPSGNRTPNNSFAPVGAFGVYEQTTFQSSGYPQHRVDSPTERDFKVAARALSTSNKSALINPVVSSNGDFEVRGRTAASGVNNQPSGISSESTKVSQQPSKPKEGEGIRFTSDVVRSMNRMGLRMGRKVSLENVEQNYLQAADDANAFNSSTGTIQRKNSDDVFSPVRNNLPSWTTQQKTTSTTAAAAAATTATTFATTSTALKLEVDTGAVPKSIVQDRVKHFSTLNAPDLQHLQPRKTSVPKQ